MKATKIVQYPEEAISKTQKYYHRYFEMFFNILILIPGMLLFLEEFEKGGRLLELEGRSESLGRRQCCWKSAALGRPTVFIRISSDKFNSLSS